MKERNMAAAGTTSSGEDEDAALARQLAQEGALVTPICSCPHVEEHVSASHDVSNTLETLKEETSGRGEPKCRDCGSAEIWICMKCGIIKCSRYANQHMLKHYEESTHCIACSFIDLSFWCFECGAYLDFFNISKLHEPFRQLHQIKFQEEASLPTITLETSTGE